MNSAQLAKLLRTFVWLAFLGLALLITGKVLEQVKSKVA